MCQRSEMTLLNREEGRSANINIYVLKKILSIY